MKSKKDTREKRKWTIEDVAKVIFLVSIIGAIFLAIFSDDDNDSYKPSVSTEYYHPEHSTVPSRSDQQRKQLHLPSDNKENRLINELDKGDYYDHSDYYDGLDGEHSDIDYNEVRDYFED